MIRPHFSHRLARPARAEAGLTLIELLVSLVILGFVITVMSGAFFQIGQVVRIAESVNGQFQPRWVHMYALTDVVANLYMPDREEKPFVGDAAGFRAFSLSVPQGDWGQLQPVQVSIVANGVGSDLTVAMADEKPIVVASWDAPMEFGYLAVDGSTESMWPPFGHGDQAMPSGVIVHASDGDQKIELIAPYLGPRKPKVDTKRDVGKLFGLDMK